MKKSQITLILVCIMSIFLTGQAGASLYTRSLSSSHDRVSGIDKWVLPGVAEITWAVTQNQDMSWNYDFVLTVPETENAISHFILEVSPSFAEFNIFNADGDFIGLEIKNHLGPVSGSLGRQRDFYAKRRS